MGKWGDLPDRGQAAGVPPSPGCDRVDTESMDWRECAGCLYDDYLGGVTGTCADACLWGIIKS